MKKITLPFLLLYSSFIFSQDCKYKRNEIDEFTKNKILETKENLFTLSGMGLGFSCAYTLKKINDNRYINLHITAPSIFTLRESHEIMFKTEKDSTIDLKFIESIVANGTYNTSLKSTHWSAQTMIPITAEAYERLKNEKITKLRVYTVDGHHDDDVSEKRDKKFKELLKCIE
ncbi:hypothetical protein [Flavobacterium anhuiense]|uniref:hypothetical protein n=1 Tax=Flavobacterium anhuiense TaxID=459526 RepID=UPI0020260BFB|nr:hypothetical protein [Flavobacterium anhuiense]URM37195.1 hypothetical protein LLY39_00960 [Flavobacterium anhuiense]